MIVSDIEVLKVEINTELEYLRVKLDVTYVEWDKKNKTLLLGED